MATKKKEEIKIINSEEAQAIDPELEPAGFKRDEQLAKRKDNLEQAVEEASEKGEMYSFDPSKFDPENEIMQLLDELEVEDSDPNRRYFWCYEGQNGYFIRKALRLGWKVVDSAEKECPTLKDARGYRKLGDTILLQTSVDQYKKIEMMREYKQLLHEKGVGSALKELGERYRDKGFIIHDDASEVSIGPKNKPLMDMMKTKSARQTAMKGIDNMLREGTVPGMPAGRRR